MFGSKALSGRDKARMDSFTQTFTAKKDRIRGWLVQVRDRVTQMHEESNSRIHYVRWRMKEATHIQEKLRRKWSKYRRLAPDTLFSLDGLTDIAGVRILVLYQDDLQLVDERIWDDTLWEVAECTAWYDESRTSDREWFSDHGFLEDADRGRKQLKKTERGYSSIHYLLVPRTNNNGEVCELQLRTIHQEAWAEFDHELKYPSGKVDDLASELIKRLSALLNVAEDMVSDIRRSPAAALILEQLWARAVRDDEVDHNSARDELIKVFLPNAPYLYRSAPLAALDLLCNCRRSGPTRNIVTLDFADPLIWATEALQTNALRRIYVDAHGEWIRSAPPKSSARAIRKYFVSDVQRARVGDAASALREQGVDVCCISNNLFAFTHDTLDSLNVRLQLARIQFFLWDTDTAEPKAASLPFLPSEVYGFYSPSRATDLTSSVVWITGTHDTRALWLRCYIDLLDNLVDEGLISRFPASGGPVLAPRKFSKRKVRELIATAFADHTS